MINIHKHFDYNNKIFIAGNTIGWAFVCCITKVYYNSIDWANVVQSEGKMVIPHKDMVYVIDVEIMYLSDKTMTLHDFFTKAICNRDASIVNPDDHIIEGLEFSYDLYDDLPASIWCIAHGMITTIL
jgi:hypothetical protein